MGKNSNSVKSEQLGMSFSTANNQLKKNVLFDLVKRCNLDKCFQCGEKIEDISNFSIEHKTPWLHSDDPVNLFFSLDNIAFSHTSCNYSAARYSEQRGKPTQTGYKGVGFSKSKSKPYRAYINTKVDGVRKSIHLGYFETPEEAAKEFDKKAVELYGESAMTNKSLGLL
ncbi:HNH endonuclease [Bacillus phage JBP901]|uniref:Putative HNH homing endonuclease n=1 Tax=Bacillus phage JBP901 TaxID=1498212 RepID=A0A0E3DEX4_9CAUD|nr:HNH endonuclease [Bacillus phage JBP901]AID17913.1 putative HNH homing endonuclease [Bacillus phage JBP901]